MIDDNDAPHAKPRTARSWRDRLMLATLIAGGVLTLSWILVLLGLAWQVVSAVAYAAGHG